MDTTTKAADINLGRPDNELSYDHLFFSSRGKIKNPKRQTRKPVKDMTLTIVPETRRKSRGMGNIYQNTKTGIRPDIPNINLRSRWESNFVRVLELFKIKYEYEAKTFEFPRDTKGRLSAYLPDFYLPATDEYIEVKGMLDGRGRNKLRKFKKNYPDEFSRLTVVISKSNKNNKFFFKKLGVKQVLYYEHLTKLYQDKIVNWEK